MGTGVMGMWPGPSQDSTSMGTFTLQRKGRSRAPTHSPPAVCFSSGQGWMDKDHPVSKSMLIWVIKCS